MKTLKLSNRLTAAARFILPGAGVIDVGTDHGFLPVWLALSRTAKRIVATDINAGPLQRARMTAAAYGVDGQIEFMQTDGLQGISNDGIDTVVIAGMGGETMTGILEKAGWVFTSGVRLILQPQTKLSSLVSWLETKGFALSGAALAEDEDRIYEIMLATREKNGGFRDLPRLLLENRDALLPAYLDREILKARRILEGLDKSSGRADADGISRWRRRLRALESMKEETEKWQR